MLAANAETHVVLEINKVAQYLEGQIPTLLSFAMKVVLALVVFFVGAKLIKLLRKIIRRSLERANTDVGVTQFLDSFVKFVLYALLIFSIGKNFGLDTTSVAALVASGGVAIGLALQGSLSNFAGGVLILILKPFAVGDYIIEDTNKCEGTVAEIQLFYTKLQTVDNRMIVVPNGTLVNNSITNVTAQALRKLDLRVDISYNADLRKAKELIEEILRNDESVKQEEEIIVFVDSLGTSSVVIGARAWVATEEYWTSRWRILEIIKLTLDKNGIEIPFQQIVVHNKSAE